MQRFEKKKQDLNLPDDYGVGDIDAGMHEHQSVPHEFRKMLPRKRGLFVHGFGNTPFSCEHIGARCKNVV